MLFFLVKYVNLFKTKSMQLSNIFILSGPSGAGEDSVIAELGKLLPLEKIITTTTRPMRPGEIEGHDYYFTSVEKFQQGLKEGAFVEYAQQYNGHFYGVSQAELARVAASGKIGLWKIEYQGVQTVKQLFPQIKAILLTVPDLATLERRIRNRDHVSEEYIQERMAYTKIWLQNTAIYDYTVINADGHLAEAVAQVKEIIEQNITA